MGKDTSAGDRSGDPALDGDGNAADFDLRRPPPGFHDDPYAWYDRLRATEPVKVLADGSVFLTRYDDVAAMYRNPLASSDKKAEFRPKYGDTPLYEHHTSSLVFNDAPMHPRVRRPLLGAVNQRAIARMEAGVRALVDQLLDAMQAKTRDSASGRGEVDLIADFAAAIPVEVIGNLLAFPREDRGPLRGWSLAILAALEPAPTPAMLDAGNRAVVGVHGLPAHAGGGAPRASTRSGRGCPDAAAAARCRRRRTERAASCCTTASSCSMPGTRPPPT